MLHSLQAKCKKNFQKYEILNWHGLHHPVFSTNGQLYY